MPDNIDIGRKNIRLREYDYSSPGAYMVTVCANVPQKPLFGVLKNGSIKLSEIGRIIEKNWLNIPVHFPGVKLDAWIIMPDHIHGILLFELVDSGEACLAPTTSSTHGDLPNLGAVVGSFKSAVTKEARKSCNSRVPLWQRGYFEHVIRNQADLERAREYIALNPLRWELEDKPDLK